MTIGNVTVRVIHAVRVKNEVGNGVISADINVVFFWFINRRVRFSLKWRGGGEKKILLSSVFCVYVCVCVCVFRLPVSTSEPGNWLVLDVPDNQWYQTAALTILLSVEQDQCRLR